jgi:hypothetical protein
VDEIDEIVRRPVPDGVVGRRDVEPLGLDEQPVETHDGDARAERGVPEVAPPLVADLRGPVRQRERGDFDAVVAELRDAVEHALPLPVDEGLVADGEFHAALGILYRFAL